MEKRNELIAYAMDFCSYLVSNAEKIEKIILFGSVAKDQFDAESDIDLFIHTKERKLEQKIKKIVDNYYLTEKFRRWGLNGIDRAFSCIVGDLDSEEWRDLKISIANTGILLYGKYESKIGKAKQFAIFSLKPIKPEVKRVVVHKQLFGFSLKNKSYRGIVSKYQGAVLGRSIFMVPCEYSLNTKKFLNENKISFEVYDIWRGA